MSSYFESREAQQPLCGTRPHSQATADGPEGGPGILTLDKTPRGLNPDKSTREPQATLRHGERGWGGGQEQRWGAGVCAGWGPRASSQLVLLLGPTSPLSIGRISPLPGLRQPAWASVTCNRVLTHSRGLWQAGCRICSLGFPPTGGKGRRGRGVAQVGVTGHLPSAADRRPQRRPCLRGSLTCQGRGPRQTCRPLQAGSGPFRCHLLSSPLTPGHNKQSLPPLCTQGFLIHSSNTAALPTVCWTLLQTPRLCWAFCLLLPPSTLCSLCWTG